LVRGGEATVKRLVGVWIIGVIAFVGAVIEILAGLSALGVGALDVGGVMGIGSDIGGAKAIWAGVIMLVIGALYLIFAVSFLGRRRWAWTALLTVSVLAIIGVIVQFVFDQFYWSSIAGILLPLAVIVYLIRPQVRRAFVL